VIKVGNDFCGCRLRLRYWRRYAKLKIVHSKFPNTNIPTAGPAPHRPGDFLFNTLSHLYRAKQTGLRGSRLYCLADLRREHPVKRYARHQKPFTHLNHWQVAIFRRGVRLISTNTEKLCGFADPVGLPLQFCAHRP
jgi:hypothetical protein